jgi:hypothetical protein
MNEYCEWKEEDPDYAYWETSCGQPFGFVDGKPTSNEFKYCCFCGKLIKEIPAS